MIERLLFFYLTTFRLAIEQYYTNSSHLNKCLHKCSPVYGPVVVVPFVGVVYVTEKNISLAL